MAIATIDVPQLSRKPGPVHYFLFGIGLSLVWWGACFVRGARMDGRAGKAASAYLSQREGVSIAVKSGGIRLWVWPKEIERAHHRLAVAARQRDTQTASALRNQEWITRKEDAWNKYRQQHSQDPEQGG